jgi:phage-related minor tail protein
MSVLLRCLLYGVLPAAVLLAAGEWCYSSGLSHGKAEIQSKWDAEKAAQTQATDKVAAAIAQKEKTHAQDTQRAADALDAASQAHAAELAAVRADAARSVQRSDARAAIYQREAQSGAAACSALASHTTELDRSLEAGRGLVGELRATLELRDRQLVQVGEQLMADRRLFNTDATDPAQ